MFSCFKIVESIDSFFNVNQAGIHFIPRIDMNLIKLGACLRGIALLNVSQG